MKHNIYGNSVIEQGPQMNGLPTRQMRPAVPPYVEVEVIDGAGNVGPQRTGTAERYWREHLEEQVQHVGDQAFPRIVVAILNGPGALAGEALERARALHGYRVTTRGIELLPGDTEIRRRREAVKAELERQRRAKPADRLNLADATALIAGTARAGGDVAALRQQLEQQAAIMAQQAKALEELQARLGGAAPSAATEYAQAGAAPVSGPSDEDTPAPPPPRRGR